MNLKNKRGITLIALIITIIVLLILAGVSIMMLAGENGILNRAVDASEATKEANEEEKVKLAVADALSDGKGTLSRTVLEKAIGNIFGEDKKEKLKETETGVWTYEGEREIYEIVKTGTVRKEKKDTTKKAFSEIYENTAKITIDEITVTIPAGFAVGINEEYGHVNTGLVITDGVDEDGNSTGNEFVWIPVNLDLTVVGTNPPKPMAKVSTGSFAGTTGGLTNYEGILYEFTGEGQNTTSSEGPLDYIENKVIKYGQGTTAYREPDTVSSNDNNSTYLGIITGILKGNKDAIKFADYKDMTAFKNTMQEDYNKMIQSVKENGGFYVSRYEMGVEGGMAISKSVVPTDASKNETKSWYGLYGMAKTYENKKKTTESSVESSMIWGSQYDAMLNYALTGSDKEKVNITGNADHSGIQNLNSSKNTGTTETDKIINIYDLEGNLYEYTLLAYSIYYRAIMGGSYHGSYSPSRRGIWEADGDIASFGSRFTIYIK